MTTVEWLEPDRFKRALARQTGEAPRLWKACAVGGGLAVATLAAATYHGN